MEFLAHGGGYRIDEFGASASGKPSGFGPDIRGFESSRPRMKGLFSYQVYP
jgi:hypothetical protein